MSFFEGDFFGVIFGFFADTGRLAVVLPRPTDFAFVTAFIGTLSYQIAPERYKSSHFNGRTRSCSCESTCGSPRTISILIL